MAPLASLQSPYHMQLSRYLKTYDLPEQPGQSLLYSTRQASMAVLPEDILASLRTDRFADVSPEVITTLTDLSMLVPDLGQEKHDVLDMIHAINRANTIPRISVVPGMACNFACVYCYEGEMKSNRSMTDAVADQLIAFAKQRFMANTTRLELDFYGGEPLLYTGTIKRLATALRPFAAEQNAGFRFSLISNGSLLTREIASELKNCGLSGIKITLDGPAALHNQSRPFKSGGATFDRIIDNIKACCDIIPININGNYTRETYQDFPLLLDLLLKENLGPDRVAHVTFHPVISIDDPVVRQEFTAGCVSSSEPWLAEASLLLRQALLCRGYRVAKISPSPCMIDINNAFMVDYDGVIYKCPAMIGHAEYKVGDIFSGIRDYRQSHQLDNWRTTPACADCAYLPLCFGGCRFMQYQRTGSMAGVDCQKDFLDNTLGELLKQQLRYPTA